MYSSKPKEPLKRKIQMQKVLKVRGSVLICKLAIETKEASFYDFQTIRQEDSTYDKSVLFIENVTLNHNWKQLFHPIEGMLMHF